MKNDAKAVMRNVLVCGSTTIKIRQPSRPDKPPDFVLKLLRMLKVRSGSLVGNERGRTPQEVPEFTQWERGRLIVTPPPDPAALAVRSLSHRARRVRPNEVRH